MASQTKSAGLVLVRAGDDEVDESDDEMENHSSKAIIHDPRLLYRHEKWKELAHSHVTSLIIEDDYCALTSIPNDIHILRELRALTLKWSPVRTLSCLFNMSLTNLSLVECCHLQSIEGVQRIETLEVLEVNSCQLEALPANIGILSNLETLDVSGNKLKSLPLSVGQLGSLKILSCGANSLTALPVSIGNLNHLSALDLSRNRIEVLPDTIGDISQLKTLRMSDNRLSKLPNSFGRLDNLQFLFFGKNRFGEVPAVLKSVQALNSLNMNANQISTMKEPLPQLRNLILDKNRIEKLPEPLFGCVSLELLNIAGNKFDTIPDDLCQLKKLKVLYLGGNDIKELPVGLASLQELRHLGINQTQIEDLPDEFASLVNLNILDLSDTQMSFDIRMAYKKEGVGGVRKTIVERQQSRLSDEYFHPPTPGTQAPTAQPEDILRGTDLQTDETSRISSGLSSMSQESQRSSTATTASVHSQGSDEAFVADYRGLDEGHTLDSDPTPVLEPTTDHTSMPPPLIDFSSSRPRADSNMEANEEEESRHAPPLIPRRATHPKRGRPKPPAVLPRTGDAGSVAWNSRQSSSVSGVATDAGEDGSSASSVGPDVRVGGGSSASGVGPDVGGGGRTSASSVGPDVGGSVRTSAFSVGPDVGGGGRTSASSVGPDVGGGGRTSAFSVGPDVGGGGRTSASSVGPDVGGSVRSSVSSVASNASGDGRRCTSSVASDAGRGGSSSSASSIDPDAPVASYASNVRSSPTVTSSPSEPRTCRPNHEPASQAKPRPLTKPKPSRLPKLPLPSHPGSPKYSTAPEKPLTVSALKSPSTKQGNEENANRDQPTMPQARSRIKSTPPAHSGGETEMRAPRAQRNSTVNKIASMFDGR